MIICQDNHLHAQKFQKKVYNKEFKSKNYIFDNKVCLNNKYITTNENYKLEAKFF